jgi:hypothetical protein
MAPRVKKAHDRASLGINRTDIAALPRIASKAGISKVVDFRWTAVLAADDVVYLMRRIRIVFVKKAVLTPVRGAFCNESPLWIPYFISQAACVDVRVLLP